MGGASVDGEDGVAAPSLQVIILGSGGGPLEHNTTAFLVRSLSSGWRKGSVVAVDAGVHLSAITRILEQTLPPGLGQAGELSLPHSLTSGPFEGFQAPFASPEANAAHLHRNMIDTYLITHPHLDHIAGFVINTAGLPGSRPKRLAGLPTTISAFKTHIFNNVIWPNLSDENNGAGLVTYMRLVEGGSPAFGDGEGKGYLEITDGLSVKVWSVSHGHCIERHSHRGSGSSSTRFPSLDGTGMPLPTPMQMSMSAASYVPPNYGIASPRSAFHLSSATPNLSMALHHQQQRDQLYLANTSSGAVAGSLAPSGPGVRGGSLAPSQQLQENICVYDSSAYFIRDIDTGREVLIFGDVEPDTISLSPRNLQVWQEAAPKIAAGKLAAIFIECSYDDSQTVDRLFGHLAPRYIIQEMASLAEEVRAARRVSLHQYQQQQQQQQQPHEAREREVSVPSSSNPLGDKKKRKREPDDNSILARRKAAVQARSSTIVSTSVASPTSLDDPVSPKTVARTALYEPSNLSEATSADEQPVDGHYTHHHHFHPQPQHPPQSQPTTMPHTTPHLSTPTAELRIDDMEMHNHRFPTTATTNTSGTSGTPATPHSAAQSPHSAEAPFPLRGLKVVIIHVKNKMNDGPATGDVILRELAEYERAAQLGCEFVISRAGESLFL